MLSAHPATEMNIQPKFNENLSKGLGDMEQTRKCYGQTYEGLSYNPLFTSPQGIEKFFLPGDL